MMKVGLKYWRCCIVLAAVSMALLETTAAFACDTNPGVLPPQSHPYGHTYGEWSNAWWQWVLSIPTSVNPLLDQTGADCSEGQSGKVWFLAGTTGGGPVTRNCIIPVGKALFFPVVNFVNSNLECPPTPPDTLTVKQLHEQLDADIASVTTLEADVDGVTIQHIKQRYRAKTDNSWFSVTFPSDNIFGCPGLKGKQSPLVSDGYYLMLAPLPVGSHTIHFMGGTSDGFTTEVTYHLTVQPKKN
jgi:hypothetical protein